MPNAGEFIRAAGSSIVASGTVNTDAIANGASQTVAVTFPAGRFTSTPRIVVTPSNGRLTPAVQSPSATGFTAAFFNWSGANAGAAAGHAWIAVQE